MNFDFLLRKLAHPGYIPEHPIGHGKDCAWRQSPKARKKHALANRRKAKRRKQV